MKMFRNNHEPMCAYCKRGQDVNQTQTICEAHGIVESSGACKRFAYNPLRRKPNKPVALSAGYKEEDFWLEDVPAPKPAIASAKLAAEKTTPVPTAAKPKILLPTDLDSRSGEDKLELNYMGLEYEPGSEKDSPPVIVDNVEEEPEEAATEEKTEPAIADKWK